MNCNGKKYFQSRLLFFVLSSIQPIFCFVSIGLYKFFCKLWTILRSSEYGTTFLQSPKLAVLFPKSIASGLITCLFFLFIAFNAHADIQLSLQPTPVIVNEPASLIISSTDGKAYIDDLPKIKNLKWTQSTTTYSKNVITINGRRFEQTVYQFVVSKPGVITLPLDGKL